MQAISVAALSSGLTQSNTPVLIDVRRQAARLASGQTIDGAIWRDPALWLDWKTRSRPCRDRSCFFVFMDTKSVRPWLRL